ncbi:unnamed protein product [Phytophthora lilii]|uniref:beta-glucosidase n=1 Tax=Phytophthora lilii TaxID=2077276 RepID=A0A9W6YKT7_9STRA|nr:unnamed protein product [Phytophthora lilii]
MVPDDTTFFNHTKELLAQSPQYLERLKTSARRVMKLQMGLYDTPMPGGQDLDLVGSDEDVASALNADSIGRQCGGWSISWQGYTDQDALLTHGVTVKTGIEQIVGNGSFSYFNGLHQNGSYSDADLATAKEYASKAGYNIVAIGEDPYAEKGGDINNLSLPAGQVEYVKELASTGTKVIIVLFEGRPRLLGEMGADFFYSFLSYFLFHAFLTAFYPLQAIFHVDGYIGFQWRYCITEDLFIPENAYAVVNGLLSCELGGQTMAEILYGKVNPSGRMPITYPKHSANVEMTHNHPVTSMCENNIEEGAFYCENQWDFGTGLSYTDFTYSEVRLSRTLVETSTETVDVSVDVTNSGNMAGKGNRDAVPDPSVPLAERARDEAAQEVLKDQSGAQSDADCELHADGGRLERVLPPDRPRSQEGGG